MPSDTPRDPGAQTFAQFLQLVDYGEAHGATSDALRRVLDAMQEHAADNHGAAKGEVTVKVALALDRGALKVKVRTTRKQPEQAGHEATLFLTPDGLPTARDPRQATLNLTVASGPAAAPKAL